MTPRMYYAVVDKATGEPFERAFDRAIVVHGFRTYASLPSFNKWDIAEVHIIPAAEYAAMQAIVEAARTLVEGASTAPESRCEWCGDGKTAVAHLADMDGLREVVESTPRKAKSDE